MSDTDDVVPRELPLLVGHAEGDAESLLLIGEPVNGRVLVRRWTAADWSAPPVPEPHVAAELLRWIEAQAARGRTLNQSLYGVRLWLNGQGADPRTR